jgi:hypothetical protein
MAARFRSESRSRVQDLYQASQDPDGRIAATQRQTRSWVGRWAGVVAHECADAPSLSDGEGCEGLLGVMQDSAAAGRSDGPSLLVRVN